MYSEENMNPVEPPSPIPPLEDTIEDTIINPQKNNTMTEIQDFNLPRIRQEESYSFHQLVLQDMEKCTHPKFAPLLTAYRSSFARFDAALKTTRASVRTTKLTDLDYRRDAAYRGLRWLADMMLPVKPEAAEALDIILRKYGDPTHLPYMDESGALDNFIQDLEQPQPKAAIATLNASPWVEELKTAHNEFKQHFYDRGTEQSDLVTGELRQARLEVDAAHKACVKFLNAMAIWEGVETIATIIQCVNERIDYQKQVLAARKSRNAVKETEESK